MKSKKLLSLFVAILFLVQVVLPSNLVDAASTDQQDAEAVVLVPDANLAAAINATLGNEASHKLTIEDLESLTTLTATNKDIKDLTGLNLAKNLTSIDLSGNDIYDVSALANLPELETIELSGNHISDLSMLSGSEATIDASGQTDKASPQSLNDDGTLQMAFNIKGITTTSDYTVSASNGGQYDASSNLVSWQGLTGAGDVSYEWSDVSGDITFSGTMNIEYVTPVETTYAVGNVIIHHADEDGNKIAEDQVITGRVGESYEASSIQITGYTAIGYDDSDVFFDPILGYAPTFTAEDQNLTFIYSKDATVAPTPAATETPAASPSAPTPVATPRSTSTAPMTGDQGNMGLISLGFALVLMGGTAIAAKRKVNN